VWNPGTGTDTGVEAVLPSAIRDHNPSDLEADVHTPIWRIRRTVKRPVCCPVNATSPPLKNGTGIPARPDTRVPPNINKIRSPSVTGH